MLIRLLIYLVIIMVVYRAAKSWLSGGSNRQSGRSDGTPQAADDAMVQDPQCGVYLTRRDGVTAKIDGQVRYFCSEACKRKYLESTGHAV